MKLLVQFMCMCIFAMFTSQTAASTQDYYFTWAKTWVDKSMSAWGTMVSDARRFAYARVVNGSELVLVYTLVDVDWTQLNKPQKKTKAAALRRSTIKEQCYHPEMGDAIEGGLTVVAKYVDAAGNTITHAAVNARECDKMPVTKGNSD